MSRALTSSTAIGLVILASQASADVTPQEVWASWQAMSTSAGQELTVGDTVDSGDVVEVTDLAITTKDQMGGSAGVTFDKLVFTDNGDGTVTVTMPDSYPIQMAFPKSEDGPGTIKLTVAQPGTVIVAGGSATDTSYQITAPTMTVTLDEVTDETGKVLDTEASMVMTEVAGGYLVTKTGEIMGLEVDPGGEVGGAEPVGHWQWHWHGQRWRRWRRVGQGLGQLCRPEHGDEGQLPEPRDDGEHGGCAEWRVHDGRVVQLWGDGDGCRCHRSLGADEIGRQCYGRRLCRGAGQDPAELWHLTERGEVHRIGSGDSVSAA